MKKNVKYTIRDILHEMAGDRDTRKKQGDRKTERESK